MKRVVGLVAIGFGITLALIVGLRLERAGLAVLVGFASGLLGALPGTALLLYLWWKERTERTRQAERSVWDARPAYPPVVILEAGRNVVEPLLPRLPQGGLGPREFVIVGEEERTEETKR